VGNGGIEGRVCGMGHGAVHAPSGRSKLDQN
jgi:hypothetical protein